MIRDIKSLAELPKDQLMQMTGDEPETKLPVYRFLPKVGYGQNPPQPVYFIILEEKIAKWKS